MPDTNLDRLKNLLAELFMLDQADLDFGIYRVMNAKRAEVTRFLETDLLPQVRQTLAAVDTGDRAQIQEELAQALAAAQAAGFAAEQAEQSPKVKELRARLAQTTNPAELENEVFSDLTNFFRRYYQGGDFLALRRYKAGVYAIPYEGEEVKLHWANADQYYIKTSEYLRDYTFKLSDGRRVHFKLVQADTEADNKKPANGQERRFILCPAEPLLESNGELVIRFDYRPDSEKRKQADLNTLAAQAVFTVTGFANWKAPLAAKMPTEKNPDRTLLEKHLADYTARNSFDYFIHKDIGGFLRRELDFFIKNEIMHLDDIEDEQAPRVEQYLAKVKAIRAIARKIIAFLEQLENFQKRLWLKKKFVFETNYCVTLDRVAEALYPEIAANDAQRTEWVRLFAIDEIKADLAKPGYSVPLTMEFLKANPFLVLDTKLSTPEFKEKLLADNKILGGAATLDQATDGLLLHSENFNALNLLQARYHEQVPCIYIDPPYNTGDGDFPYKDSYQHSSWLSMLRDRLALGRSLQPKEGTITVSIDDVEIHRLRELLDLTYGPNELAKLAWDRNRKNDAKFFSVGHEYMLVFAADKQHLKDSKIEFREPKEGLAEAKELVQRLRNKHGDDWAVILKAWFEWLNDMPLSDPRRRMIRFNNIGARGPYRDDGNINWPGGGGPRYEVLHPTTKRPTKIPNSGWRFPTPERFWEEYNAGRIVFGPDENTVPGIVTYLFEGDGQVMPSVFYSYAQTAAQEFDAFFGARVFDNPKSFRDLARIFRYLGKTNGTFADFFAGSGTTAHAVITLNREDSGKRKYILVEMGDYFDTVLKPRIQKVIYSKDWKDGKPVSREGSSHLFKYLRLESYEDALNNLELKRTPDQDDLLRQHEPLREDYMLRYQLDVETRDSASLLNLSQFTNPFAYQLKIATGSVGESRPVNVDLVETFNYLLGLRVSHMDTIRGFRVVQGVNPNGEKVLVIWRNVAEKPNAELDTFFQKQGYNTKDLEFALIYVNGDNNLENLRRADETWKVRRTEDEFKRLMFDVRDV
jgi:adenine-specific DNA-methyltransferase